LHSSPIFQPYDGCVRLIQDVLSEVEFPVQAACRLDIAVCLKQVRINEIQKQTIAFSEIATLSIQSNSDDDRPRTGKRNDHLIFNADEPEEFVVKPETVKSFSRYNI